MATKKKTVKKSKPTASKKKSSAKKQNNNENDQKKQLFKNLKEKYAHYFNTKKMTFLKLMIQMICYYIC